jgi:ectoine hydroxylase-related dioxygenase (phytanoyl-CoA dioxygenase family)
MNLAPALRHSGVLSNCRKLAAQLLGAKRVWCHFDHIIYKHPGADPVPWHQNLASSKTGLLERAVPFLGPLHDLTPESACMMFVPGSPSRELLRHVPQHDVGGTAVKIALDEGDFEFKPKTLSMGGFSVHTPRTVHASAANQGNDLRKAWILQFRVGPGDHSVWLRADEHRPPGCAAD